MARGAIDLYRNFAAEVPSAGRADNRLSFSISISYMRVACVNLPPRGTCFSCGEQELNLFVPTTNGK
jgi:hypothetical protein